MQVLVIYGSRLGATRGIAERIATRLREDRLEVTVQPASGAAAFTDADAFVIGSGVYGGHWVKEAAEYVRKHRAVLVHRPVWLFSSGPVGDSRRGTRQSSRRRWPGSARWSIRASTGSSSAPWTAACWMTARSGSPSD